MNLNMQSRNWEFILNTTGNKKNVIEQADYPFWLDDIETN